jgi:hypothetical protein
MGFAFKEEGSKPFEHKRPFSAMILVLDGTPAGD